MCSFHKLIHLRGAGRRVLAVGVFGVMLLGCAHHAPATLHQRMTVISGKGTSQDNPKDAARKVLIEAAAITLDHGYRYFEIVGAPSMSLDSSALPTIRPGADVTIKVFGAPASRVGRTGDWGWRAAVEPNHQVRARESTSVVREVRGHGLDFGIRHVLGVGLRRVAFPRE